MSSVWHWSYRLPNPYLCIFKDNSSSHTEKHLRNIALIIFRLCLTVKQIHIFFVLQPLFSKIEINSICLNLCWYWSSMVVLRLHIFFNNVFQFWIQWQSCSQRPRSSRAVWKWIQIRIHAPGKRCNCFHQKWRVYVCWPVISDLPGSYKSRACHGSYSIIRQATYPFYCFRMLYLQM